MPCERLLLMPPNRGEGQRQLSEHLLCILFSRPQDMPLNRVLWQKSVDWIVLCFSCARVPPSASSSTPVSRQTCLSCMLRPRGRGNAQVLIFPVSTDTSICLLAGPLSSPASGFHTLEWCCFALFPHGWVISSSGFLHLSWAPVSFTPIQCMFNLSTILQQFCSAKILFFLVSQLWIYVNIFSYHFGDLKQGMVCGIC